MKRMLFLIIGLLAGCTERPVAVTSDSVLDAQYRARTPHGVMTGNEAQGIADAYRKNIAMQAATPPQSATGK